MFKVEVIGNLGADCEVRDANGNKFATIRIAHTDKWTDAEGKEHSSTTWVDGIINDVESKVIPYLRQGVKVFVRGNATLRVYSSPKEKQMKAGLTINVREIELCGGQTEDVPRRLINPDTAAIHDVSKYYWCNAETKGMKKDDIRLLVDEKGRQYGMNSQGFVAPVPEEVQQAQLESQTK